MSIGRSSYNAAGWCYLSQLYAYNKLDNKSDRSSGLSDVNQSKPIKAVILIRGIGDLVASVLASRASIYGSSSTHTTQRERFSVP